MMIIKHAINLLAMAIVVELGASASADENRSDPINLFSLDGKSSIMDAAHCGIINGKVTVGIPHQQVTRIDGLWAPPYVSSDFALRMSVLGKEVSTQS